MDRRGGRRPYGGSRGYGSRGPMRGNGGSRRRSIPEGDDELPAPRAQGDRQGRRTPIFGYRRLEELQEKDPAEVLHILVNDTNGFPALLDSTTLKPDWVKLMLAAISRATQHEHSPATIIRLLNKIMDSKFMKIQLNSYITSMLIEPSTRRQMGYAEPLKNLVHIMREILLRLPMKFIDISPLLITTGHVTTTLRAQGSGAIDAEFEENLKVLQKMHVELIEKEKERKQKKESGPNFEDMAPPDDFRVIDIFPKLEDINLNSEPFLRANRTTGGYDNLEHYLDVQFRLLREDFICPLREGIMEYLNLKEKGGQVRRLQDIKLYFNVNILHPECTPNGIAYRVRFDVTRFKHVRWQSSKRLLYGSLVCLSADDFQTLFFATVSNRKPEDMQNGEFELTFHQNRREVSAIPADRNFVMAETTAYFEAYRYVLRGLQTIQEQSFPFCKYIVECQTRINSPNYLTRGGNRLDMRALTDEPEATRNREYSSINVLNSSAWPSAGVLRLDESQWRALQTALTKEFAVIQGPPGTGKTFIGLQIVRLLLENKNCWMTRRAISPIFVVCYTNHALDQFLEGIQSFHDDGIVRVGGRCQSENLSKYKLKNLKQNVKDRKLLPGPIAASRYLARQKMNSIKHGMEEIVAKMNACEKGILNEEVLRPFMGEDMYDDLKERLRTDKNEWEDGQSRGSVLLDWLGFGRLIHKDEGTGIDGTFEGEEEGEEEQAEDTEDEEDDTIDVEEEADLITAQRIMDEDTDQVNPRDRADQERQAQNQAIAERDLIVSFTFNEAEEADGWQVQGMSKKKRKQKLKRELQKSDVMTENEVDSLTNIWALAEKQRWRLYRYWLSKHRQSLKDSTIQQENEYQAVAEQLLEVKDREDYEVLKDAMIIGMTTTGAAKYRSVLQDIKPQIVIVEEAAEVLESHIVTTLSSGCEHLILIGDHKQLRPTPTVYKLAKKFNLDISLFERMVRNGMERVCLERQHRMRPEIADIVRNIYPELMDDDSVSEYPRILGVEKDMFFIDHAYLEAHDEELRSRSNDHEAKYIAALCNYLLMQGYEPRQITVLTTYTGQVFRLKKFMPKAKFEGVRVSAVDNYQGEENDIILLSLVRSNRESKIGFLGIDNRVCVALSRAKMGFYVIGNMTMLSNQSELWSKVVRTLKEKGAFGKSLALYCQNHPNESRIDAITDKDFNKAPEGGCLLPCATRLNCGHVCTRACHTYDRAHEDYKCMKKCTRDAPYCTADERHKCKRFCFQDCGKCNTKVEKRVPSCGHSQKMDCSMDAGQFMCKARCDKKLPCGHTCQKTCGEAHTTNCNVLVIKQWPCGHRFEIRCHEDPGIVPCPQSCRVNLQCDHRCKGSCGTCKQGRLHEPCKENCGRTLVCGHACKEPCTKNCPPCKEKCQNRCNHSKCPKKCGELCQPCKEPCYWSCQHHQCQKLCSEPCDRPRCNQPCPKILRCNHPCIGLCGERCPRLCRVCDKEEVEEIFFGEEDEPDARFVQLLDCKHCFEVNGLDQWMDMDNSEVNDIQLKSCPKCKTPIRRNLRYGSIVNEMLQNIEKVKERIQGSEAQIHRQKSTLYREIRELEKEEFSAWKTLKDDLMDEFVFMDKLHVIENQINFLKFIVKLNKQIEEKLRKNGCISEAADLRSEIKQLKEWLMKPRARIGEQELTEFKLELQRLQHLTNAYQLQRAANDKSEPKDNIQKARVWLSRVITELTSGSPLSEKREEELQKLIKEINNLIPTSGLGISNEERLEILKAMGLSKGHWYKCPKGHIYAIGDCGGANEGGRCPECNSAIGGMSHRLAEGNTVASEMDGARYAAWSEQANMENYGFNARF